MLEFDSPIHSDIAGSCTSGARRGSLRCSFRLARFERRLEESADTGALGTRIGSIGVRRGGGAGRK